MSEINKIALIDFLNVAYHKKINGKASLKNFHVVRKKIRALSPKTKVLGIADPSAPYSIDERKGYKQLVDKGIVIQVGPGEEADYYMIKFAENKKNCYIFTNDAFRDYEVSEELKNRIIPICIIEDDVIFSKKFENIGG